jgi:hypothetical protein
MVIDNDLTRKTPGQGYGSAKLYILYTYIHPSTLSFWSQVNTFYHSDTPPTVPMSFTVPWKYLQRVQVYKRYII